MKRVYNAQNTYEAQRLSDILKAAGIRSILQEAGAGGYMKVAAGISVFGTDIYVDEEDMDRARQILREELGEAMEQNIAEQESVKQPWYRNPRVIARIILGVALVGLLAGLIMGLR